MSIQDIRNQKLKSLDSLFSNKEYQFSKSLKDTFEIDGKRDSVEPFWVKAEQKPRLEPIFTTNETIRPIISKELPIEEETFPESTQNEQEPMEIDDIDLSPLLETLAILNNSSSQVHAEERANTLKQLVTLTPAHLEANLAAISFPSWRDDTIADLVNELVQDISTSNIVNLLYKAVYPKIVLLQSSTPRLMMNSILQLAKKEGRCVLDGLILPLLFLSDLARPQLEVVTKVTSESLNPTQRLYLLQCIMDDGESFFPNTGYDTQDRKYLRPWKDTAFQIINTILSTQPYISLTKSCLFDLLHSIQTIVQSNPKDKGSMQILLLLTSKYPQMLLENQALDLVQEICQASTMFLKRAVIGQITSLKKTL